MGSSYYVHESSGYALTSVDAPTFPLIIGGWRQAGIVE